MPETERKLVLHSPASSEYVEYRWPLTRTETWDEAVEIVETIRWVCRDFPDLKLAVEKFVLNSFEPTSFESMKQLCERYNRAVANIKKLWSGRQPPPGIDAPPSIPLLKHIVNQAYNRAITSPEDLNSYEPFSPEVYGETSFELVCEVMKLTKMTENDVFVDLGSGIGQIVLQVAAKVGCKCYGIEKADIPAKFAESMEEEFVRWMDWYGKSYGEFELLKGDFLDAEFDEILQSATIIFTNNFAFGPKLNHELKLKFSNLKDETKIISSHEFCPLNFRITPRNTSDIGSIMHVAELSPLKGSVSWTGKQVSYYLHTVDRGKLEKFYHRQKHPEEYKSEDSSSHSGSSSSDDSCSESSSDSNDDQFKDALRRIKLSTHNRAGSKKGRDNHHSHHKAGQPRKDEQHYHRKRGWPKSSHLKSGAQKDSNSSSALSSSAVSSPGLINVDGLFSSFHHQLEAYMSQLGTPYFQQWIVDAIEKEKMKKTHLQGVITHLESEVAGLSKETVEQMKENMKELGIRKMTPDGLLLGATNIVSQNKQLRKEMTDLEREITSLRQQNTAMEAMCVRQKGDPKLLQKLPLFSPEQQAALTNGIASPRHVTQNGEGEPREERPPTLEVTAAELEEAVSLSAEDDVRLSTLDSKHLCLNLVKEYEIELERIDQQLLELGPYAQDAYDEEEPPLAPAVPLVVSPLPPPPETRRGKKGKQTTAAQRTNRRASRNVEDHLHEPQRGGGNWRTVGGGGGGGGWSEMMPDRRGEDKEPPKKKWRKVGSAGPTVRGKEGQLDAHSDPLNVSSANIIVTPDLEMRPIYQPQMAEQQERPGPGGSHAHHPTERPGSTTASSTPSCNTSSPSDLPGHARSQPTAHWNPVSGMPPSHPHPLHEGYTHLRHHNHPHHHHQFQVELFEETDVMKVENDTLPNGHLVAKTAEGRWISVGERHLPPPPQTQTQRGLPYGSKHGHQYEVNPDLHHAQTPSPKTTAASSHHGAELHTQQQHHQQHQQHHVVGPHYHLPPGSGGGGGGGAPKQPGFSISHLAKGAEVQSQSSSTPHDLQAEHRHLPIGSPHSDIDVGGGGVRKRRSSSSSSHRSIRQPSMDDGSSLARSGSPLSASHVRGQYMPGILWDNSVNSPGTKDKPPPQPQPQPVENKLPAGMSPFAMWPPGMPVPTDPAQVQRIALSSQFLAASNPWLRGGMIPGLPLRPALYPTAAAAAANSLDPSSMYKSMLAAGVPLYQLSAAGLNTPFGTPAFSVSNSAANSQPQTPSSISAAAAAAAGFSFIPPGLSTSALCEAQSRLQGGAGQQLQMQQKPEVSQDAAHATQPWPLMSMLQPSYGFQSPLSSSQASQLNLLAAQRGGSVPFSTSPLTLVTQSFGAGGASTGDITQSALEAFHQQQSGGGVSGGRRNNKKQPGSTIDLTREQVVRHIEAPSPQEAVKMATQRMSPFHDPSRFSPKLKSVPEVPPSSSPLLPSLVTNPNTLTTQQAQGHMLSYPVLSGPGGMGNGGGGAIGVPSHHLLNPSQMMGVALSGSHVIYPPLQGVAGGGTKAEEVPTTKKRRSPKRGGGAQKLRIHQMDFKPQGKVDRRRKRPWKPPEKTHEETVTAATKPLLPVSVHGAISASPAATASNQQTSTVVQQATSEDTYALNMLADCSSKEGEKPAANPSGEVTSSSSPLAKQELAAKRALMRSPGSIAGANSLLLLAKPDSGVPPLPPPPLPPPAGRAVRPRDQPPEHAVVDGLLKLSNSPVTSSSVPPSSSTSSSSSSIREPHNQNSVSTSEAGANRSLAAEAILMMGGGGEGEAAAKKSRKIPSPISTEGEGGQVVPGRDGEDADSEKTDTDSEATLSPTTPAPTITSITSITRTPGTRNSPPLMASSSGDTQIDHLPSVAESKQQSSSEPPPSTTRGVSEMTSSIDPLPSATGDRPPVVQQESSASKKRELLDIGPSSTRLQMIGEDEDADVDVENLDSSMLDEPVKPVFNSQSEAASKSEQVFDSPQQEEGTAGDVAVTSSHQPTTSTAVAPEIIPTSPQSQHGEGEEEKEEEGEGEREREEEAGSRTPSPAHPPRAPPSPDLTNQEQEDVHKTAAGDEIQEGEEEEGEEEEVSSVSAAEAGENNETTDTTIVDAPSPPKRPRLEETAGNEEEVVKSGSPSSPDDSQPEKMDTEPPLLLPPPPPPPPQACSPTPPPATPPPHPTSPQPQPPPSLTEDTAASSVLVKSRTPSPVFEARPTQVEPVTATEKPEASSQSRDVSLSKDGTKGPASFASCSEEHVFSSTSSERERTPPPTKEMPLEAGAGTTTTTTTTTVSSTAPPSVVTEEELRRESNDCDGDGVESPSACILWPSEPGEATSTAEVRPEAVVGDPATLFPSRRVEPETAPATESSCEHKRGGKSVRFSPPAEPSSCESHPPSREVNSSSTEGMVAEKAPPPNHVHERGDRLTDSSENKAQTTSNVLQVEKTTKKPNSCPDSLRQQQQQLEEEEVVTMRDRASSPQPPPPPPPVVQNRLPVGKSGFDRHQQSRKLLSSGTHAHKQHNRDEKGSGGGSGGGGGGQSKKWSRASDQGQRGGGRGLFDVDPLEGNRRPSKTDGRPSDRDIFKHVSSSSSEARKAKPRSAPPPPHGHSSKLSSERPKYANSSRPPRVGGHEEAPARHGRQQEGGGGGGGGGSWDQKELGGAGKVKPRASSGRQGSRFSPSSSSSSDHTPTQDHLREREDPPLAVIVSDEDQSRGGGGGTGGGRVRVGHQNSHGWRDDRYSPTEHARERGGHVPSKHKSHRPPESKQGFEHGRKIVRLEKDPPPQLQSRKHETNTDERGGGGGVGFKRHRGGGGDDDSDHAPHTARLKHGSSVRKRSYESVSEDELLEEANRSSSRESSLVGDRGGGDRGGERRYSSQEAASDQRWRKEAKRVALDVSEDVVDDFSRAGSNKHKKHKHESKERKERRKWRKVVEGSGSGGESKQKRNSDDKAWLGYHKH